MGERNFVPFVFDMPDASHVRDAAMRQWCAQMTVSVQRGLQVIAARVNGMLLIGTAAERPAASGSMRLFWQTDGLPHMEFDDGTWHNL